MVAGTAEHKARCRDYYLRNRKKRIAQVRAYYKKHRSKILEKARQHCHLRKKPPGTVYRIPTGRLVGRLQLDYRDEQGHRRRRLCPPGTTFVEAEALLHELQTS